MTNIMVQCPECSGDGWVEVEIPKPQGFGRDIGYIDTTTERCEACNGEGEIELLCDCGEPVPINMGQDAEQCPECAEEEEENG